MRQAVWGLLMAGLALVMIGGAEWAFGWDEPKGFRDVPWGASVEEVQRKIPDLTCTDVKCAGWIWVGNIRMGVFIDNGGEGFDNVGLSFRPDEFDKVRDIFVERYGRPTSSSANIVTWNGQRVLISLMNGGGIAAVSITTLDYERRRAEKRHEEAKKAKKDL
jgi:hypothetical protein